MILDSLNNSDRYLAIHPGFKDSFEFLKNYPIEEIKEGKHIIEGDRLFAIPRVRIKKMRYLKPIVNILTSSIPSPVPILLGGINRRAVRRTKKAMIRKQMLNFIRIDHNAGLLFRRGALRFFSHKMPTPLWERTNISIKWLSKWPQVGTIKRLIFFYLN